MKVANREDEFYKLYKRGYSDNEIAKELGANQSTVSTFRQRKGLVPAIITKKGLQRLEDRIRSGEITKEEVDGMMKLMDEKAEPSSAEVAELCREAYKGKKEAMERGDKKTVFTYNFLYEFLGAGCPRIKESKEK